MKIITKLIALSNNATIRLSLNPIPNKCPVKTMIPSLIPIFPGVIFKTILALFKE